MKILLILLFFKENTGGDGDAEVTVFDFQQNFNEEGYFCIFLFNFLMN